MTDPEFVKLPIHLTKEQVGSFPVSIEHLWFERSWIEQKGDYYRLKNIPQFVDEVAFDDVVKLHAVAQEAYVITDIVEASDNSTLWVLFKQPNCIQSFIQRVKALGCGIEGGALEGYYAINVPIQVDIESCYAIIDTMEHQGILVADYPCLRQGD